VSPIARFARTCIVVVAVALSLGHVAPAGEALMNKEVLEMVKDGVSLDVILQKIVNSQCHFDDTSAALREVQKSCNEAKWDTKDVGILQKKIMEVANLDQKRLKELVSRALNNFDNADPKEYELMMRELMREGRTVVPFLLAHLEEESERKRGGIADALGRIGDKGEKSVSSTMMMLYDPSAPVRLRAAECVAKLSNEKTCEDLISKLNNRNNKLDGVAMALGYLADPRATDALTRVLTGSADSDARVCSAWALGEIRTNNPASLDALLQGVLDERDGKLRNSAAGSLARIREKRAPSYIIKAYQRYRYQPEPERMLAHLSYFKDGDVVEFLLSEVDSDNPKIKAAARQALCDLTGEQNLESAEEWRGWWEVNKVRPDFIRSKLEQQKMPDPRGDRTQKSAGESIPTSAGR
jgi:HEAT repeat protein